ncbi:MAG TPA: hypothetical protein VFH22_11140 [Rhodocyclaceae bacterium]|nr:hypothetical protein [Rhodocyclaceae bacterium]
MPPLPSLRLLELSAVPAQAVREFRAAAPWIATTLVGAFVAFCLWVALRGGLRMGSGALPGFIAWWIVFWLGLYWLLLLGMTRKAQHPDAWLVRADDDGLYIKWRSFQNVAWGADGLQVVFVPYALIVAARRHKRRWNSPESRHGGIRQEHHTFLELQLGEVDTEALRQILANERDGKPGGKITRKARWGHFPLSVEPGPVLRLEWRAKPGIRAVLELLGEHGVDIAPDADTRSDLHRGASPEELAELARRGDLMTLIRVLRVCDDLSLEQARSRAKALIAGADPVSAKASRTSRG